LGAQFPQRLAKWNSGGTGSLFPNHELVGPKASGRPAESSGWRPHRWTSRSESEPSICLVALYRATSPGKKKAREGLGSVTITSDQVARPAARDGKPILQTSKTLNSKTHANRILLQILAQSRISEVAGHRHDARTPARREAAPRSGQIAFACRRRHDEAPLVLFYLSRRPKGAVQREIGERPPNLRHPPPRGAARAGATIEWGDLERPLQLSRYWPTAAWPAIN
jgi:hypothetical protein